WTGTEHPTSTERRVGSAVPRTVLVAGEFGQAAHEVEVGLGFTQAVQSAFEAAQRVGLETARFTLGQVDEGAVVLGRPELTVDERREALPQVLRAHWASPLIALAPRSCSCWTCAVLVVLCSRARRNCARPRWMRLRTVPSLTSSVAAISS